MSKYGISCTSRTAALEMGLLACGIGAGDEVIIGGDITHRQ